VGDGFGIFNLMGSRDPEKPTAEVFAEVAEQIGLADELGYAVAWFAEHHLSNYCLCASTGERPLGSLTLSAAE
jgi:alkanesulfonate monooxygenase SsuD/methylene tetrahydromethanopterin reductase-like flavin-dependent oxidoreductase (luciferase family)